MSTAPKASRLQHIQAAADQRAARSMSAAISAGCDTGEAWLDCSVIVCAFMRCANISLGLRRDHLVFGGDGVEGRLGMPSCDARLGREDGAIQRQLMRHRRLGLGGRHVSSEHARQLGWAGERQPCAPVARPSVPGTAVCPWTELGGFLRDQARRRRHRRAHTLGSSPALRRSRRRPRWQVRTKRPT